MCAQYMIPSNAIKETSNVMNDSYSTMLGKIQSSFFIGCHRYSLCLKKKNGLLHTTTHNMRVTRFERKSFANQSYEVNDIDV